MVTKALAKWDQELARQAKEAAAQEANTGGGQFFSIRGGTLALNDSPLPNNEIAAVIVDSVLENVYYADKFDPESLSTPSCYAFGRDEKVMAPHEEAEKKQHDNCAECPLNAWGSGEGRGKACRNRRRLAVLAAGTLTAGRFKAFKDEEAISKGQVAYLALPPTSINGFGAYVKQVAGALQRPPHGVYTRIKVVPDAKTQIKVTFEVLGPVDKGLLPAVMARHTEVASAIVFAYPKAADRAAPKRVKKNKRF